MVKLNERNEFIGTFVRSSIKKNYKSNIPVILFSPVTDINGNLIFKELWMNYNKGFESLVSLKYGDKVVFNAMYEIKSSKFGENRTLSRPNNIRLFNKDESNDSKSKSSLYDQNVEAILRQLGL